MSKKLTNHFYLSGPMTGRDDFNFPAFHQAAQHLRKNGYTVFNPAESFNGKTDLAWTTYMEHDYEAILDSAAVVVMEGWERSVGCIMELLVAVSTGKNVFLYTNTRQVQRLFKNSDNARDMVQNIMDMYVKGSEPKTETIQKIQGSPEFGDYVSHKNTVDTTDTDHETILEEAQRLVHGDRGSAYGHPYDDFSRTAQIWSAILGIPVSAEQVSLCMVGLKISREVNKPKRDNRVDGAGYFETLDMVRQEADRRARLSLKAESKLESSIKQNKKLLKKSRKVREDERMRRQRIVDFVEEARAKYDLDNALWDDYDDKGIPYWDKWTDESPEGIID